MATSLIILAALAFITIPAKAQKTESISNEDLEFTYSGINPAEVNVETGKEDFNKVEGSKGKSCASCHGEEADQKMAKGMAGTYPKYIKNADRVLSLQTMVNFCRDKAMGAEPIKLTSERMASMVVFLKSLSNGEKVNIQINHEKEKKALALGKLVFSTRRGKRNLSCEACHETLAGKTLRMQALTKVDSASSHWPGYRTKKGQLYTIEGRFQQCMKNATMKKLKAGSDEMIGLELYLTKKSNGSEIQVPGMIR